MWYDLLMVIERIQLGYWYPRTTLHLTEIQNFLAGGTSPLSLDSRTLARHREKLGILSCELRLGELEYLDVQARDGISMRLFEDGLVTISDDHQNLEEDVKELFDFFNKSLQPALHYLFSIGAPTPKILANIEHEAPCFIVAHGCDREDALQLLRRLDEQLEFELDTKDMVLYRGKEIFVINVKPHFKGVHELIETWIYFKEFKAQLHHYMNLHRTIWQEIEAIKEEKSIRGWRVKAQRTQLESYKKTIELIEARIGQMDLYMPSRSSIATSGGWDAYLSDVLQFRYTNLEHTHDYVRSLWVMTKQYIDSAIQVLAEINAQSTKTSVQALTAISSLGVIAAIGNYLSLAKLPKVNRVGVGYFFILLSAAILVNGLVQLIYRVVKYRVNTETLSDRFEHPHGR
jgi:hypothetical protein